MPRRVLFITDDMQRWDTIGAWNGPHSQYAQTPVLDARSTAETRTRSVPPHAKLRDDGVISDDEFAAQRAKLPG